MNPTHFRPFGLLKKLIPLLIASVVIGNAAPAPSGGMKRLDLALTGDRSVAKVTVPDGVATVIVQKFNRDGGWTRFAVREAKPGVMRFKLPSTGENVRWRAVGRFAKPSVAHEKFPASFYAGQNKFGPIKSNSGKAGLLGRDALADVAPGVPESSTDAPVEADIWKVDGNDVYFFNQLRGLQVLNLADPSDPRITASLRLPAEGQDLYLLPGSGPERTLVLLTRGWSNKDGERTRINVVKVAGGNAEITSTRNVPGYLSDSRMVGNRLILATTEWNYDPDTADGDWNVRSRLGEWLISPRQGSASGWGNAHRRRQSTHFRRPGLARHRRQSEEPLGRVRGFRLRGRHRRTRPHGSSIQNRRLGAGQIRDAMEQQRAHHHFGKEQQREFLDACHRP